MSSRNHTSPSAVDVDRYATPDQAADTGFERNLASPVRLGRATEAAEKPTGGDADDNPAHYTGQVAPPVTANRE